MFKSSLVLLIYFLQVTECHVAWHPSTHSGVARVAPLHPGETIVCSTSNFVEAATHKFLGFSPLTATVSAIRLTQAAHCPCRTTFASWRYDKCCFYGKIITYIEFCTRTNILNLSEVFFGRPLPNITTFSGWDSVRL